jgi:prefoldin subunit 5
MSNEFEVHNFYNHTIEELEELEEQFNYLLHSAIEYKRAVKGIKTAKSLKDWEEKYLPIEDGYAYEQAIEHFKKEKPDKHYVELHDRFR